MGWEITPADAAALGLLSSWTFVRQFWLAVKERWKPVGAEPWAPLDWPYYTGAITAIADNGDGTFTLTDSAATTWLGTDGIRKKWVEGIVGTDFPDWALPPFDVVIDDAPYSAGTRPYADPRNVLQCPITDQPSATAVKCTGNLAERVREGVASSVGAFVGRRFWILRRGGANWTRAFPHAPNDAHYAAGVVGACAAGTLTARGQIQNPDLVVGKEVVYLGATSGHLVRGAITAVDGPTLTYTGTAEPPAVDAHFYVIDPGGFWQFSRLVADGGAAAWLQAFYGGQTDGYYGHDAGADDAPAVVGFPLFSRVYAPRGADGGACDLFPPAEVLLDRDAYIPQDEICSPDRDKHLNPRIHATARGLWASILELCQAGYVKPVDFTGDGAVPIFTPGRALQYAGINGRTGTAGTFNATTGELPCALSVPYTPIPLWWTILGDAGEVLESGFTETYDGAKLTGAYVGLSSSMSGKPVVASIGPTQLLPRRVGRFYDVLYFVADTDDTGGGPALQTPSNTYPGSWIKRPKSTHYRAPDPMGFVGDSPHARHAIADGHVAQLAGDNRDDPGFPVLLQPTDPYNPQVEHYNHGVVGKRRAAVEGRINASTAGRATGGSNVRLEDAGRTDAGTGGNWLAVDFFDAFNGCVHTGTFGSGSTTGGTDATKAGTALWAASRFSGFAGPLVGFTVEVLMSGAGFTDPAAVVEKRLVATGNGTTGALTWGEALPASASGKQYRIREPYVLNRWGEHKLKLTRAGVTTTVTILGNDGDTLFVTDAGFPIDDQTAYEIVRPQIGAKYKRVSGAWVATGELAGVATDDRVDGRAWLEDSTRNLEDVMTEYGLPRPCYVTYGVTLGWEELKAAIDVLKWTRRDSGWDSLGELNEGSYGDGGSGVFSGNDWTFQSLWDECMQPPLLSTSDPVNHEYPPHCKNTGDLDDERDPTGGSSYFVTGEVDGERSYSYQTADFPTMLACSVDWYVYAWLDESNHDELQTIDTSTPGQYVVTDRHFEAHGDPVLFRKWNRWHSSGGGATGHRVTPKFGDNAPPTAFGTVPSTPPASSYPNAALSETIGYYVSNQVAIAKWDFYFA